MRGRTDSRGKREMGVDGRVRAVTLHSGLQMSPGPLRQSADFWVSPQTWFGRFGVRPRNPQVILA